MPRRDSHRSKVYAAEDTCKPLLYISTFTLPHAQRWVNKWRMSKWSRKIWSADVRRPIPVTANENPDDINSWADDDGIVLSHKAMNLPYMLIHELAHVIVRRIDPEAAGHGPEFLVVLKVLIGHYIGTKAVRAFEKNLALRGL